MRVQKNKTKHLHIECIVTSDNSVKYCPVYLRTYRTRAIIGRSWLEAALEYKPYRVSGDNGTVFDGNFPSLGERCVKTEVMWSTHLI